MTNMETKQNAEVIVLEYLEKLEDEIKRLKKSISQKPLSVYEIDKIFQGVYATGSHAPRVGGDEVKFVRAIETAHGIGGD